MTGFALKLMVLFAFTCIWWQTPLLHANEEMYLAKARGFADSDWLASSLWVHDWPGARLLFQVLLRPVWSFASIEDVSWYGRLFSSFILCFALVRIFQALRLNVIFCLLVLALFFQYNQNFFGYEWIWQGFETKVFAYFFILWALGDLMLGRPMLRICLWFAVATWFHVLIGGWAFIYFFLSRILQKVSVKELAKEAVVYVILVAPLLIYLVTGLQGQSAEGTPSADWVYVFYRHPHHLVPASWPTTEIAIAFGAFVVSCLLLLKTDDPAAKALNRYNIAVFIVVLASLLLPFAEYSEKFLKLYPYRASTLNLLFFLCVLIAAIKPLSRLAGARIVLYAVAVLAILLATDNGIRTNIAGWQESGNRHIWAQALKEVSARTPESETIFVSKKLRDYAPSFFRLADRDVFVDWKFVPVTEQRILEWYERLGVQDAFPATLPTLREEYGINYYLLPESETLKDLTVVWSGYGLVLQTALPVVGSNETHLRLMVAAINRLRNNPRSN